MPPQSVASLVLVYSELGDWWKKAVGAHGSQLFYKLSYQTSPSGANGLSVTQQINSVVQSYEICSSQSLSKEEQELIYGVAVLNRLFCCIRLQPEN